ncbi:MAG: SDR family NAD(P)-dependent oxidoreductase, partial [Dermatophilaceae bacterium]
MLTLPESLDSLPGKVAVVTGGGRGIGKMIAEGLVRCGVRVYISSRKQTDLDATVEELSRHGEVHAIAADLGTVQGVEALT